MPSFLAQSVTEFKKYNSNSFHKVASLNSISSPVESTATSIGEVFSRSASEKGSTTEAFAANPLALANMLKLSEIKGPAVSTDETLLNQFQAQAKMISSLANQQLLSQLDKPVGQTVKFGDLTNHMMPKPPLVTDNLMALLNSAKLTPTQVMVGDPNDEKYAKLRQIQLKLQALNDLEYGITKGNEPKMNIPGLTNFMNRRDANAMDICMEREASKPTSSNPNPKAVFPLSMGLLSTLSYQNPPQEQGISSLNSLDEEIDSPRSKYSMSGNLNAQFESLTLNHIDSDGNNRGNLSFPAPFFIIS